MNIFPAHSCNFPPASAWIPFWSYFPGLLDFWCRIHQRRKENSKILIRSFCSLSPSLSLSVSYFLSRRNGMGFDYSLFLEIHHQATSGLASGKAKAIYPGARVFFIKASPLPLGLGCSLQRGIDWPSLSLFPAQGCLHPDKGLERMGGISFLNQKYILIDTIVRTTSKSRDGVSNK